jgi:predicted phosphoadenosine phosphosulfate sulfurtransferase
MLINKNKQTPSHCKHSAIGVSSTTAVLSYVELWKHRDYFDDIPDEVPDVIMHAGLAPSYKAIAIALLKNDTRLSSLGMGTFTSKWYSPLKAIELGVKENPQLTLF